MTTAQMDNIDLYLIQSVLHDIDSGKHIPHNTNVKRSVQPLPEHFDYLERTSIPPRALKITVRVTSAKDLSRNIIKTDTAYVYIPEAEFEQPAGTISEFLSETIKSLESTSIAAAKLDECISLLHEFKTGTRPFTLIIDDPLSGSDVDEWYSDSATNRVIRESYARAWRDVVEYGRWWHKGNLARDDEAIKEIAKLVMKSSQIAAVTGAGISTESGIPAYRNIAGDGVWNIYSIEDEEIGNFMTKESSRINYWQMKVNLNKYVTAAQPCAAHTLFKFLHDRNKLMKVITQNIDGLHARAGVPKDKIIEIHGNTNTSHCMTCGFATDSASLYKEMEETGIKVPMCKCGGFMHPDTISYGMPLDKHKIDESMEIAKTCDFLFVIGSSMVVAPVNLLPGMSLAHDIPVAIINIGGTHYDGQVTYLVEKKAGVSCQQIMDAIVELEKAEAAS